VIPLETEEGVQPREEEEEEEDEIIELNVANLTPRVGPADFELLKVIGKGAFGKVSFFLLPPSSFLLPPSSFLPNFLLPWISMGRVREY